MGCVNSVMSGSTSTNRASRAQTLPASHAATHSRANSRESIALSTRNPLQASSSARHAPRAQLQATRGTSTSGAGTPVTIGSLVVEQLADVADRFRGDLLQASLPSSVAAEIAHGDWDEPKRTKGVIFDERIARSRQLVNNIADKFLDGGHLDPKLDVVLSSTAAGRVHGLLHLHNESVPDLCDIVALPGAQGHGAALVSAAIAQSMAWNRKGRLQAMPMSRDSRQSLERLGFVSKGDYVMELNPAKSRSWVRSGTGYDFVPGRAR